MQGPAAREGPRNGAPRPPRPWPPPFGLQVLAAVLASTLFILWVRSEWGGTWATTVFVNVASILVPAGAGFACFQRARFGAPAVRQAWLLLAAASLAWALGQTAWTVIELGTGSPPSTPSAADAGYLLFVPLAALGVLRFVRRDGRPEADVRSLLDGIIIGASFIFIAFVFGLERIVLESRQTDAALIVNLLYPFGDAVILGITLQRLSRAPADARGTLGLLAAGVVFLAVADLWFLVVDADGAYSTGGILDAFWIVGFQLIGLAAMRPRNVDNSLSQPKPTPALAILPLYPFALAALAAMYAQVRDGGQFSNTLFWTALVVVVVVLARLMVMLLDNVRLTAKQEAAAQALRDEKAVRTRMMNTITHDMLNAMSPIRLQLHMFEKGLLGDLTPKQVDAFAMVRRNAEQMARLAADIKEAANVEEGRLAILPASMDLGVVVRQGVASRQPEAEQRGVALQVEGPASVPLQADEGRIAQVVDNLLSNALKFTPQGGRIVVRIEAGAGAVTVRVTDTGRGLDAKEQGRLFEPYSQVHEANEIKEHGTGLGLFISRGIVERHDGRIWVESRGHGQGSTFAFRLPLAGPALGGRSALTRPG